LLCYFEVDAQALPGARRQRLDRLPVPWCGRRSTEGGEERQLSKRGIHTRGGGTPHGGLTAFEADWWGSRGSAQVSKLQLVEFATLEWVDWFNNRRLLEPIGNIPPAEAEERYYAMREQSAVAA
jgi:transposase InsO family protein